MLGKFWVLVVVFLVIVQQTQETKCHAITSSDGNGEDLGQGIKEPRGTNDDDEKDLGQGIKEPRGTNDDDEKDLGQGIKEPSGTNDDDEKDLGQGIKEPSGTNDDDEKDLGQGVKDPKGTDDDDDDEIDLGRGIKDPKGTDYDEEKDLGAGVSEESDCRSSQAMKLYRIGISPKCGQDGQLLPKQCYEASDYCVCVRKDGSTIGEPSKELKACDCPVEKDEQESEGLIGNYIPQCQENGKYAAQQCHYSTAYCWCADPSTGQNITEPTRAEVNCS